MALDDHQESAASVLDTGRRLDAKISSGHSGTEIALPLRGALAQRYRVLATGR